MEGIKKETVDLNSHKNYMSNITKYMKAELQAEKIFFR